MERKSTIKAATIPASPTSHVLKLKMKDFESLQTKLINEYHRSHNLLSKTKNENALDKHIEERLILMLTLIKSHSGGNQRFFNMIDKMKKNIRWKDHEGAAKRDELDDN